MPPALTALATFSEPGTIPAHSNARPCCTACTAEFAAAKGSTWMVSGWGTTDYGADPTLGQDGALPKLLQFAHVKYVQPSVCESALSEAGGPRFGSSVFDENTAMW
jgi:hypothetical protein